MYQGSGSRSQQAAFHRVALRPPHVLGRIDLTATSAKEQLR
jgi:hypothetical protein